ncbi:MAG: VWA domain-containing protein [Candidatus Eremiobacteraeota bacterium]|nr:VWA domain-containing protein [Candidatus Eremiobacteraeota bacterium]MBV8338396.1 VWA domain-containing protein [Candidatus Eremiobacteraeota bacterium]MBV8594761.1 VWA domain-containing protein [Candidatus Eremiobacteraeota bacterium]MBV8669155.1 VWA domain-containing protein [Candidatus Eremiobacteraeota bacterium]
MTGFPHLSRNLIIFGRLLRRFGLGAQPDRIVLFGQTLAHVGFGSRDDVRYAGRCVFVRTPEEQRRFDAAFDAFWSSAAQSRGPDERTDAADRAPGRPAPSPAHERSANPAPRPGQPEVPSQASGPTADIRDASLVRDGDRSFTYSFAEALGEKDFSRLSPSELELAHELQRHKQLDFGRRESRRTKPGRGGVFDARRTLRASLRQFGEPIDLRTRTRALTQRDVVLLCDISGSMDRYSRLLLQFIHALRRSIGKVEAFVFGTRLTRITKAIQRRDVNEALDDVAASVADWGGGTRIGESLREFNLVWARRVLARGAIVIIISDGWDRGDVGLLAREMQRLQRLSYRLVWLNPLLGGRNYRPQTIGMRAALPFIDDFLPAHNLKSLTQLVVALRSVHRRRPSRAQTRVLEDAS